MKTYSVDIYIFGAARTVSFEANESIDELRNNLGLLEWYILDSLSQMMNIQNNLEEC